MSDLFPISIDVEVDHLGKVMQALNIMPGVVTINLLMNKGQQTLPPPGKTTDIGRSGVLARLPRGKLGRTIYEGVSVRGLVAQALVKGPVHYKLIGEFVARNGMSPVSVNSAITKMAADKTVERVAPGTYRLTKRGERRYVQNELQRPGPTHVGSSGPVVDNRKGLRALILGALMKKVLRHDELRNMLIDNDYSANNMYNIVLKMREEGLIHRTDDNYELTDTGRAIVMGASASGVVIDNDATEHGDNA